MINESYSIEKAWKFMLKIIYGLGSDHTKDDSPIRECIGMHWFIQNPLIEKTGFQILMGSDSFLEMIRRGAFDIKDYLIKGEALADYVDSINQEDKINVHSDPEESFVYTYPERLRGMIAVNRSGEIEIYDQIEVICERLRQNLGSNRAMATIYQTGFDHDEVDIPCLQVVQALVRNDELILSVFFRSNDIYGAFPSNMMFLTNIGIMIEEELNKDAPKLIRFIGIDYHVSSAHFYQTDMDAVKKIVEV